MWLTSFRLLAFLRKGLRQFPIAQNTVPYNPTRLDRGQNQDIASADVAMENLACLISALVGYNGIVSGSESLRLTNRFAHLECNGV